MAFAKRDRASVHSLIKKYVHQGLVHEALLLFWSVNKQQILPPHKLTFVYLLRACSILRDLNQGKLVHAQIVESSLESDHRVGNALVDMYAKCGRLDDARRVFQSLRRCDIHSWTAMIAGCARTHGRAREALRLFEQMRRSGFEPIPVNYVSALKACTALSSLTDGGHIHAQILAHNLGNDPFVATSLVDMYAKCGDLEKSREVFGGLSERTVMSWTALIAGYSNHGRAVEALGLFKEMQREGVRPDLVTFSSVFKACGSMGLLDDGRLIHHQLIESQLEWDSFTASTLVDMYVKCGSLDEARKVFGALRCKDVVSWTTLIGGYVDHGHGRDALNLFQEMQGHGVKPNMVTFIAALKACGSIAALHEGRLLHAQLQGACLDSNIHVASGLIDMYAKCGSLEVAFEVFNSLRRRDVVIWTAMISGCALHGRFDEGLDLFKTMLREGLKPNKVTFVCVLSVCSRAGQIDKGFHLFRCMCEAFGIFPVREHYTCLVNLFARAEDMQKAEAFIDKILMG